MLWENMSGCQNSGPFFGYPKGLGFRVVPYYIRDAKRDHNLTTTHMEHYIGSI